VEKITRELQARGEGQLQVGWQRGGPVCGGRLGVVNYTVVRTRPLAKACTRTSPSDARRHTHARACTSSTACAPIHTTRRSCTACPVSRRTLPHPSSRAARAPGAPLMAEPMLVLRVTRAAMEARRPAHLSLSFASHAATCPPPRSAARIS